MCTSGEKEAFPLLNCCHSLQRIILRKNSREVTARLNGGLSSKRASRRVLAELTDFAGIIELADFPDLVGITEVAELTNLADT